MNITDYKFSRVVLPSVADDAPKDVSKRHGEAAGELRLVEEDRAKFLDERRKVSEMDPADLAAGGYKAQESLRQRLGKVLAKELTFRRDILPGVLRTLREDKSRQRQAAVDSHTKERERIESGLKKLGFNPADPMVKGIIQRHPVVHAAYMATRGLDAGTINDALRDNQAAVESLQATLGELKRAA